MSLQKKEQFILLIDDNNAVREALVWALEYAGYLTVAVQDGQEALTLLEKDPLPVVIFLDLMMPVLDGFEFREKKKLSSRICNIPTIITSAKTNLEKMEKMSCETFLPKPFDLNELFHLLKKIV
ncbi:response regulator [Fluoribacter dumoffii]|uniref:Mycobacterial persistence regulator A n=1 Tax=Fluoribacter dumoffii TaxID=463 RepID=A0A377G8G9_9GAMM|nr:response regulator [Fluoribacter dumoffii]KTC89538.1 sigma 54-dependent response regulator [Fluoribacter dumoffii NY 23]MCW8384731.1 response regulator [Fluoribacter dumoffii]MCW8417794.1 response regulator [Fluoribacter dumoffii]MCW8454364.1 response regulator [Fluoribacter dumoffii]MCW8461562.1 response regulator [Fluoribacter dumoffii]